MNLMQLRYFCKLAETQHYTKAAAELYISQPGLSGAIASLEEELGIKLFKKEGRNVVLTKYGKEFYGYVFDALRILDDGIAVAHDRSGHLKGTVDIGSITTISGNLLPEVIFEFQKIYPNIHFNIYQGQTSNIMKGLLDETFDIGFCSSNYPHPDLTTIPVQTQQVIAVVHSNHPLAKRDSVTLEELENYEILTYSVSSQIGKQMRQLIENTPGLKKDNVHADYNNELLLCGTLDIRNLDSSDDTTVGLIVDNSHLMEFPNLKALPIDGVPEHFHTVYMIFNHHAFTTHVVNLFVDFVKENYSIDIDGSTDGHLIVFGKEDE